MNTLAPTDRYVKPYYIGELGCEGLSSIDIAKAVGVELKVINQKIERPAFRDMLANNRYVLVTTVTKSETRGRPGKLFQLETKAAKALVATYESPTGYSYLDFLFNCEAVVEKIATEKSKIEKLDEASRMLQIVLNTCQMLTVPAHLAQTESVKYVKALTSVDFSAMLQLSATQNDIKEEELCLEPTEMGMAMNLSAFEFNKLLESRGLQYKDQGVWTATPQGRDLCSKHHWVKGAKSGYNLKWKKKATLELLGYKQ